MSDDLLLDRGSIYFFDQAIEGNASSKPTRKTLEELPVDLRYSNINPRLAAFLRRSKKSVTEDTSTDEEGEIKSKEDLKKREKHKFLSEVNSENLPNRTSEEGTVGSNHLAASRDESQIMLVDEFKYMAPSTLAELGRMLVAIDGCEEEIPLPRGLVNVLNYTWKELTEGAVYSKRHWQSLAYKSTKSQKVRGSHNSEKLNDDAALDKNPKNKLKKRVTLTDIEPEKGTQESTNGQAKRGLTEHKREKKQKKGDNGAEREGSNLHQSDMGQVTFLPLTISFSMSSRICVEQGWLVHQEEFKPEDPQWKVLCSWAVERLQLAQVPIKEQKSKLEEAGFMKKVLMRHYGDARKEALIKYKKKTIKNDSFLLINGKPRIPEIYQEDPTLQKLHYCVNDGSSVIYYPTGYIAVSQSYSGLPCGGVYTNVFSNSPEPSILATFTPFGHGSVCHLNSNTTAVVVDEEGGMMTEEDGTIKKQWKWIQGVKLNEPILIQVNEFIVIRITGVNTASLSYRWQQEAVHVSLSSLQNAKPLHSNELGLILTDVKLSSKTGRELSKTNKQKIMEKEARRKFMEKKMTIAESKMSDLVKTLEIPEDDFSHLQGLKYFQELKKLQRKVKNILDDWMEHYRIATGISSPDIQKMSNTPQMIQAIRKTQSAALSTLRVADEEEKETGKCTSHDEGFSRFLSAPARNIRWDPPKSALSSCTQKENKEAGSFCTKLQSKPGFSLFKGSENIRSHMTIHKACPVSLRNALLKDGTPKRCRCSNHQIPLVSDVEYDDFIQGQMPGIEQILVMCVVSSSALKNSAGVDILEELYEKKNKNRSMPCEQSRLDSFRLVKYDINTAGSVTDWHDCLLVRRHNVAPGMFLMYICGKLLFADYIFNGYSNSIKDLQKQIAKSRGDYRMGFRLPSDFRFSPQSAIPPEKKLIPAESPPGIESRKCKDWPLKHDCCVQETDRTASVQDGAALNMSKRSHLLCDRINNHPPP